MPPELIIAIINLVVRVGPSIAAGILGALNRPSASIEDAISALDEAAKKSAADYLAEARAKLPKP